MYKSEEKPINSDCPFGTVEYKNKCWPYFVDDLNNNNKLHYYNLLKEYPELAPYEFDKKDIKLSGLLSIKPKLYVCNVDENSIDKGNDYTKSFIEKYGSKNTLTISAEIENQLNELENEERKNYMKMINVDDTGLNLLIKKGYDLLSLETFFTSGVEETRAWTINKNCMAPQAAGIIHTDFEKGFIRAETVSYQDFVGSGGWLKSRENGKMRLEGKDYIIKDGDVLNFRFNT